MSIGFRQCTISHDIILKLHSERKHIDITITNV